MKFMIRYLKPYKLRVFLAIFIKTVGTFAELFIPYVLEYMLDEIAPKKDIGSIFLCGGVMLVLILILLTFNITGNMMATKTAKMCSFKIRKDLFYKSMKLSGKTFDSFGLPSITSRMTSDSYNVQDFIRMFQSFGTRAPLMLIGGVIVACVMDMGLGVILLILAPLTLAAVIILSFRGIPLYSKVQASLDDVVLVMRENITGIRVVKALSKEKFESERFDKTNNTMTKNDKRASTIMAMPGPVMTLILNIGLVLVVIVGAYRVNSGVTEPGVILAFLTYFNMILTGTLGLGRIMLTLSKANASANRIQEIVDSPEDLLPISEENAAKTDKDSYIVFDNVSFEYDADNTDKNSDDFAGGEREMSLTDINFELKRGQSLGIIGPTGCGKTTIINLLMRFYDTNKGHIFLDGKDIRTYSLNELRRRFGVVFQNDMVFADSIEDNIKFGRNVSDEDMKKAADYACASEFINDYDDGFKHMSAAGGTSFSGGQRQRILISRALAGGSDIIVLDDSSSALDYRTDAALRKSIRDNMNSTSIIIAQRVSSIMSLDKILVMNDGRIIGMGSHDELMKKCDEYREIYRIQMGEEA